MGALNIVLAGESAEGSGVPPEILGKFPVVTYATARSMRETSNAVKDIPQVPDSAESADNSESIEMNIPGLQIDYSIDEKEVSCDQSERPCEICQAEYEQTETVMVLPCNHFYHQNCIGKFTVSQAVEFESP